MEEKIVDTIDVIDYEIKIDANNSKSKVLKGRSKLYTTNMQMYLIKKHDPKDEIKGFAFKNDKIYNEKFVKPTFGAAYFQALVYTYDE